MVCIAAIGLFRRRIVVHQDRVRRAFQIFKLAAVNRPPKRPHNRANQHQRQGNKQKNNFHKRIITKIRPGGMAAGKFCQPPFSRALTYKKS